MDELGVALRAWSDRLSPGAVGLAHHAPRRVAGLRRSELAQLAGISVEYVVRLEQGRATTPSAQVCSALGDPSRLGDAERNALLFQFENHENRLRQNAAERDAFEKSLVADLRATTSRYPNDPDVRALVARLSRGPRFRELWELRSVGDHQGARKIVVHPDVGDIAVESNVLTTQGTDLRIVVDTPRDVEARSKFELLVTIGVQEMASDGS